MLRGFYIGFAVALLFGAASAAAQESSIETRGAWRIVADGQDFSLRTQASDAPETTLALLCRKDQNLFAFEIKSPALAGRPQGEDIRIGFKVDDEDQVWFNLASGPDGTVPIAHQTAFWIIHEALARNGANRVAFTVDNYTWRFSLDGFSGLTGSLTGALTGHCGFEPPRRTYRRQ